METQNERENVINVGFVQASELPERHGIHGNKIATSKEEIWGMNYRLVDYLTAASLNSKRYRNRDGLDYARFYHGGSVSVVYPDAGVKPACAVEEIDDSDVLRQVCVENDIRVR